MEIVAVSKSVRMSPRKMRLVAGTLSGKSALDAVNMLSVLRKRAAEAIRKTIKSAIANAVHNAKLTTEELIVKRVEVYEGQSFKRYRPSTRGRVHPYKKRSSTIKVILEGGLHGTES